MYTLAREFRFLFWAILGVIVPFGFLLYFFPYRTDVYWAWVIPHPRSSILIGAGYMGAIAYYGLALHEDDWRQTQNGMGGLVIFCLVLLIATLAHWDQFKYYHITTLVWLMFYYVGPLLVPIVYRLQRERIQISDTSPFAGSPMISRRWRLWLVARGFFYLALATFWLLSAGTISVAWPWPILPLELRVFTGQIAIVGWNAIIAVDDGFPWRRHRLGLALGGAIGVSQIAGLLLTSTPYNLECGIGIFLPVMFAEWLLTPLGSYLTYERKRSD
jgi:hypothetical protein